MCSYGDLNVLERLVAPGIPAQAIPAGKELKVWPRTDLLNEIEEGFGLLAMPAALPVEPSP